jgi:ribokinase/sulfofructose kinase
MIVQKDIDILAIGGIDMDLVLKVPRLPSFDEKEMGELVGRMPGGPAANFACAASRLGLRVASFSLVGDDESGRLIIEDFARYGVDTSLVQVIAGAESPFTVILIDPSGEKAIIVVPSIKPDYPLDIAEAALARSRVMYMMPSQEEQFLALARLAHRHGAEVMIDVEPTVCSQRDKLERILQETDIASFNQFGFRAAAGHEPSLAAARDLLQYGPHTVLVTRGGAGSLVVSRDEAAEQPGFKVPVADTTGAGDTFHAAFLAASLAGEPLPQRLRFANATAALSVTVIGPRGWLPTRAEVETFLQEQPHG